MSDFYYGDYDGFDTNDDFDHESDEDIYDDDDDNWLEDEFSEENEDITHFDAVAATILFPVDEEDNIEEIEKKADDWVEFSEEVLNKEDIINANSDADSYTYCSVDTEQNYFCYWQ